MEKSKPIKSSLTKTCSICGQQKPLSAFLEMSSLKSGSYSNICATCRKTVKSADKSDTEEESTTSSSGEKIDAKAKVRSEVEKRQHRQHLDELYHAERDKDELAIIKQTEQKQITLNEKDKRQSFLEKRRNIDADKSKRTTDEYVVGGVQQAEKEGRLSFDAPVRDTHIAGKIKHQNPLFNSFKTLLGGSAPIASNTAKKDSNKSPQSEEDKESLADYIKKNWGPRSRS